MFKKIIIIGDIATGKTSIINRFIFEKFDIISKATTTPYFYSKIIKLNEIPLQINFWDLPGQDRNQVVTGPFARYVDGIIFCCDVENKESRDNLKMWEQSMSSKENIENVPKIIVENKCDLLGDESNYNDDINSLRLFSKELGCTNFFRVSAKLDFNIKEAINFLINEIVKKIKEEDLNSQDKIGLKPKSNTNTGCC
jgi:small GTP-binding protein